MPFLGSSNFGSGFPSNPQPWVQPMMSYGQGQGPQAQLGRGVSMARDKDHKLKLGTRGVSMARDKDNKLKLGIRVGTKDACGLG